MKTRTFLGGLGLAIATCLAAGSDDAGPRIVPADLDAALAWASDTAAWEGLRGARYVTAISLKAGAAEGMTALVRKELAPPGPPDGPEPQETAGSIEWIKYDVSLLVHVSAESADAALDGLLAGDRRPFAAGEEGYVVVGDGVLFPEGGEAVSQGHRTAAFRAGRYNAVIQQDWQGRRELPEGPDPVRSLLDEDLRSLAQALAERAAAASESAAPEYSVLFDKLQDLEARGDRLGALRVIPSVFECDIPVDAFQETLAATRARLMEGLLEQNTVLRDGLTLDFAALRILFGAQELARPDALGFRLVLNGELPVERYLYYMAVAGRAPAPPQEGQLAIPATPDVDPAATLADADPWIVAASLFLARKGYGRVSARQVLDRWTSRRDLWDDVCTAQALLFLAGQDAQVVAGARMNREDIEEDLGRLAPAAAGRAEVHVLVFDAVSFQPIAPREVRLEHLEQGPAGAGPAVSGEERVALPESSEGVIPVEPGLYRIRYLDGAVHGTSQAFEAARGRLARVCIMALGGV